jgi:hypothetical protein
MRETLDKQLKGVTPKMEQQFHELLDQFSN